MNNSLNDCFKEPIIIDDPGLPFYVEILPSLRSYYMIERSGSRKTCSTIFDTKRNLLTILVKEFKIIVKGFDKESKKLDYFITTRNVL